jgi:hypothetical protein
MGLFVFVSFNTISYGRESELSGDQYVQLFYVQKGNIICSPYSRKLCGSSQKNLNMD